MTSSHWAADALFLKIAATISAATAAAVPKTVSILSENGHLPFFNVTISTLGMAAAGSMLAFAYGTPIESRRKLYGYAIGGMFIGIWSVQLMLWQGVAIPVEFRPPIAGAAALLSRWVVPFLVDNFAVIGARIFGRQPPSGE